MRNTGPVQGAGAIDRFAARRPWAFGVIAAMAMFCVLVGLDAAFGGDANLLLAILMSLLLGAGMVVKGHQRRRASHDR